MEQKRTKTSAALDEALTDDHPNLYTWDTEELVVRRDELQRSIASLEQEEQIDRGRVDSLTEQLKLARGDLVAVRQEKNRQKEQLRRVNNYLGSRGQR